MCAWEVLSAAEQTRTHATQIKSINNREKASTLKKNYFVSWFLVVSWFSEPTTISSFLPSNNAYLHRQSDTVAAKCKNKKKKWKQ